MIRDAENPTPPRISVMTPCHNAVATLGGTLSSLVTADYPDLEILVVDDGSSDASLRLAETYASQWPAGHPTGTCVRVLRQDRGGVSSARNRAMSEATGDFLAFVDADDMVLPQYFSVAMNAFAAAGGLPRAGDRSASRLIVVSNAHLLTPSGINPGRVLLRDPLPSASRQPGSILTNNIAGIFAIFPRELLEEVGYFDEDLDYCEDWDLWLRAVRRGWRIVRQDNPTALYRWTGQSASTQRENMYAGEDAVLLKALGDPAMGLTADERINVERRLAAGSPIRLSSEAENAFRQGDLKLGARLLRQAAQLAPSQRRLRVKSIISYLPYGSAWLGRRQRILDERVGFTREMTR